MTPFALGMLRNHGITYNSLAEYQRWQADAERRRVERILAEVKEARDGAT